MDNETIGTILTVLLGGGGLAALINSIQSFRSKKAGVPAKEDHALIHTGSSSPDWQSLNSYWVAEMAGKNAEIVQLRQEVQQVRADARRRERHQEARNDQLVEYIWTVTGKPPPPPPSDPRRKQDA